MNEINEERRFAATFDGLADAAEYLQERLDNGGCSVKAKTQLMVAIDEIASNIVRYSGAPDFTVRIEISESSPVVRLVFSDSGKAYNPLDHGDPDVTLPAEQREIGGLGIFMVKKMMDEIEYANVDGRNVLTIGKKKA